jgi:glutamyl-tRNA synthetase/glutamyl-Q tRNA(Asp) synthetase
MLDLAALRSRLPTAPLTRFAPSPTGRLHLGHVVHAVFVWGVARALGGRVLLRIEDHDRERSSPEHEAAILDDLAWLGLAADHVVPRQSDRAADHRTALRELQALGLVYACRCSRREIAQAGGAGDELRYPGTCRGAGLEAADGLGLRVRLDDLPEAFEDARLGPQVQVPSEQCGDLLVRDRAGQWTYQFAVTVDDTFQGVDLVIRGEDLLASTGRQIKLSRLLGRRSPPVYLHHPLVYNDAGAKLSKSNRDAGLDALRSAGWPPAAVLGLAAARAGLVPLPRPLAPRQLASLFGGGAALTAGRDPRPS